MSGHASGIGTRTDEDLILAFQQGDETAFTLLVRRYKDPLMNYAYRFIGDRDDADDIVQETFVRLYRSKDSYKSIAKFSTWLYTITTNLAKTRLQRKQRTVLFRFFRREEETPDDRTVEIPDLSAPATDAGAESSLRQAIIQKALDTLSDAHREIIVLSDIQELSYEEIAAITGVRIGTVKSRLNRAREQLKVLLKELHDEE